MHNNALVPPLTFIFSLPWWLLCCALRSDTISAWPKAHLEHTTVALHPTRLAHPQPHVRIYRVRRVADESDSEQLLLGALRAACRRLSLQALFLGCWIYAAPSGKVYMHAIDRCYCYTLSSVTHLATVLGLDGSNGLFVLLIY